MPKWLRVFYAYPQFSSSVSINSSLASNVLEVTSTWQFFEALTSALLATFASPSKAARSALATSWRKIHSSRHRPRLAGARLDRHRRLGRRALARCALRVSPRHEARLSAALTQVGQAPIAAAHGTLRKEERR